ncbi:MAG: hypothetical protein ACJ8F7_04920 [Gemmataceae bacterium]
MGFDEMKMIPELEQLVRERTHSRVRELNIALDGGRIVLRGVADSFHLKQLAQHGILDVMPKVRIVNDIVVQA